MREEQTVGELRSAATRVLDFVQLREVVTASVNFQAPPRPAAAPFDADTVLQVKADRSRPNEVQAWCRYTSTCLTTDSEAEEVWAATVEVVGLFDVDDPEVEFSELELKAFGLLVGAPAVHPYARALLQSLTAGSVYPAFTLGLMNPVGNLPEDEVIQWTEEDDEPAVLD